MEIKLNETKNETISYGANEDIKKINDKLKEVDTQITELYDYDEENYGRIDSAEREIHDLFEENAKLSKRIRQLEIEFAISLSAIILGFGTLAVYFLTLA